MNRNAKLAKLIGTIPMVKVGICNRYIVMTEGHGGYERFKPCENWAQLMPLVVEHKLNIEFEHGLWAVGCKTLPIKHCNAAPQLAMVDCLIDILERKNNESL